MKNCHHKSNLFSFLYYKFCQFIDTIVHFFEDEDCCSNDAAQSGELMVTGEDEISIPLTGHPIHIRVFFKGSCNTVPCNPVHSDDLAWEVIASHCHTEHVLHITWNVSDVRDVVWKVCY